MPGHGIVPQPCILVPASDLYSRRHTETRSLRPKRKKDPSKAFCGFSNISLSLGPAQTNISSRTQIQLLFFPAFFQIQVFFFSSQISFKSKCHMESLKTKLLPPALCWSSSCRAAHSLHQGWSCLVGALGLPGATEGEWGMVSGTCPQLVLSAGKNCSEITSFYVTQSQTQGAAVWALIFAPPKPLYFPELSAGTTHLASPSARRQAKRRKAGMLCREGSSCVILHNSTDLGGFSWLYHNNDWFCAPDEAAVGLCSEMGQWEERAVRAVTLPSGQQRSCAFYFEFCSWLSSSISVKRCWGTGW